MAIAVRRWRPRSAPERLTLRPPSPMCGGVPRGEGERQTVDHRLDELRVAVVGGNNDRRGLAVDAPLDERLLSVDLGCSAQGTERRFLNASRRIDSSPGTIPLRASRQKCWRARDRLGSLGDRERETEAAANAWQHHRVSPSRACAGEPPPGPRPWADPSRPLRTSGLSGGQRGRRRGEGRTRAR
jgi:hypothetical protein